MEISLIEEGLKFLVLGMTTVYIFLYVMVLVLKAESKIVKKYFSPIKKSIPKPKTQKISNGSDDEIVAAITAAIVEHRKS